MFRENILDISCGNEHIVAVGEDGQVFVWGNNADGRLGTGDLEEVRLPKKVLLINSPPIYLMALFLFSWTFLQNN